MKSTDNAASISICSGKKKMLHEVTVMRPIVIFLLLAYHCFCFHNGAWDMPQGTEVIEGYRWVVRFIKGFQIEAFVLIAGYLFAYQCIDLGRRYTLGRLARKKISRLLIPCFIFSIIYYGLFYSQSFTPSHFLRTISNGAGHLWFLPMLFWCFIGLWVIDRLKPNPARTFCALAVVSIFPIPVHFFGLASLPHYFLFVYCGYLLWIYRQKTIMLCSPLIIIGLGIAYIITTIGAACVHPNSFNNHIVGVIIDNTVKTLLSMIGVIALYMSVIYFTEIRKITPPGWVIWCSSVSYGVYIFHQFFLHWLYYRTELPQVINGLFLPWVSLAAVLAVSIIVTYYILRTRIGKLLIG